LRVKQNFQNKIKLKSNILVRQKFQVQNLAALADRFFGNTGEQWGEQQLCSYNS
jgi:hypothetical protein